jgi:hypothetical protein
MFIVDVLKYDIENVPSLLRLLNNRGFIGWRRFREQDFSSEEVISGLQVLVRAGMILVLSEDMHSGCLVDDRDTEHLEERIDSLWFKVTRKGMKAWEKWTPPPEPDVSNAS